MCVVQCVDIMKRLSSLSIFFPALNDAKILPYLIARAYQAAQKVTNDFEIIVVNDGSTDETEEVLTALKRNFRHLRSVTHHKNLGYGAALKSGFRAAKRDWVFYTDGDGQYDPMDLIKLVARANKRTDIVNGYKISRADNFVRTVVGLVYNSMVQALYRPPIRDIDCDFRLIRRTMLQKIRLESNSGAICLELVTKLELASGRFTEVPITHYARLFGKSQFFQFKHMRRTFDELRKHQSAQTQ